MLWLRGCGFWFCVWEVTRTTAVWGCLRLLAVFSVHPDKCPTAHLNLVQYHASFYTLSNSSFTDRLATHCYVLFFFTMTQQPPVGQGLLIVEASRSHSDAPQSVRLLWTSDKPNPETFTWKRTTLTRDMQAPDGIRTHNLSRRAAAHPCLRPRGHRHRRFLIVFVCFWRYSPQWARASSFTRFLDHTQRRIALGMTPLDEWSACRRDLYLTTHNTHNRHPSKPPTGFEPTISADEQP